MEKLKAEIAFVAPDGTTVVQGRKVRVCLGNPLVEGSLYSDNPTPAVWNRKELIESARVAVGLPEPYRSKIVPLLRVEETANIAMLHFAEVHRELFKSGYRYKGLFGGRASTKSVAVADYLLISGVLQKRRYLCVRQFFASIRTSVRETLGDRASVIGLADHYAVQGTEVVGGNGSYFPFKGLDRDPESAKSSHGLNGVWVEEAQNIKETAFQTLLPTVREAGSELIFTANRVSREAPVDRFFYEDKPDDALLIESSYMDNPWLTLELSREILRDKERDPDLYAHKWGGDPVMRSDARVVKRWKVADLDEEVLADERIVPLYGLDHGFVDPSAFVEAYILPPSESGQSPRLYIADERYESGVELSDLPAFMFGTDERTPRRWSNPNERSGIAYASRYPVVVDSARPDVISLLREHDIAAYPARKGPGSIERGIRAINDFEAVFIHPSCENTIREANLYQYRIDPHTDRPTQRLVDENNHCVDSIRYLLESVERNLSPGERLA